jgi:ubiquinone/menaquinone biosynthesis C-methylase UbiE
VVATAFSHFDDLAARAGASLHARGRLATSALLDELPSVTQGPLLEIGCGTGETAVQMCRLASQVVAADVSTEMLSTARARARWCGVDRLLQTALISRDGRIPFATGAFGVVVVESVLAIQPDEVLRRLVDEICRVVPTGGRVLVNETTWMPASSRKTAADINRRVSDAIGLIQSTLNPFDAGEWAEMFSGAGLKLIKSVRVDDLRPVRLARHQLAAIVIRSRAFTIWRRLRFVLTGRGFVGSRRMSRVVAGLAPDAPCLEGRLFILEPGSDS